MKLQIIGTVDAHTLAKKIIEVVESTIARVEAEHEGVKINGFSIVDADIAIKFDVEGINEPQMLTVEHYKGMAEPFTWVVNADEGTDQSNQNESLYDEWSVSQVQGKEHTFETIETKYEDADLTDCSAGETFGNMSKEIYHHKDGFKVIKIYQNDNLIQEYVLVEKNDTVEQTA